MLTHQTLLKRLSYNQYTGIFIRNSTGKPAGTKKSRYVQIAIDGKQFYAHRLAWLYIYGAFPLLNIDHINGNKRDNRIANLREATVSENGQNRGKQANNKSGYKGVYWSNKANRWVASIRKNNKTIYIGSFLDPKKAYDAYIQHAKKIHTHNAEALNV